MTDGEDQERKKQRRTRRLSIFLILGIAAVVAIGVWMASTWYAKTYGSDTKLPPLPSLNEPAGPAQPK